MMDKLHLEDQDFLQWRWHGSCWGSNSWNSSREGFLRGSWCSLWSRSSPPRTGSSSIAGHPLSFPANQNTTCYCQSQSPLFKVLHWIVEAHLHVHVRRRWRCCLAVVAPHCYTVHCPIKYLQIFQWGLSSTNRVSESIFLCFEEKKKVWLSPIYGMHG